MKRGVLLILFLLSVFLVSADQVGVPRGCVIDSNCEPNEECVDGVCVRKDMGGMGGERCRVTADCSEGKVCERGNCVVPELECVSNNQCGHLMQCRNGQCLTTVSVNLIHPEDGSVFETGDVIRFEAIVLDADVPDHSYSWSFGNGGQTSVRVTENVYEQPGDYQVIVYLFNNDDRIVAQDSINIRVERGMLDFIFDLGGLFDDDGGCASPANPDGKLCLPGFSCVEQDGVSNCVIFGDVGEPCDGNGYCVEGLECLAGRCSFPEDGRCNNDEDCVGGLICKRDFERGGNICGGNLGDECRNNDQCIESLSCINDVCIAPLRGLAEPCESSNQCEEGLHCLAGRCNVLDVSACQTNDDCANGFKCHNEECFNPVEGWVGACPTELTWNFQTVSCGCSGASACMGSINIMCSGREFCRDGFTCYVQNGVPGCYEAPKGEGPGEAQPIDFCDDDEDCAEGLICRYNYKQCGVGGLDEPCINNWDCSGNFDCVGGKCSILDESKKGGDVKKPQKEGEEVEEKVPCIIDKDCDAGFVCEVAEFGSFCLVDKANIKCEVDTDCGEGEACTKFQTKDGVLLSASCEYPQNKKVCEVDTDCDEGDVCREGACLVSCVNEACPQGFACVDNACQREIVIQEQPPAEQPPAAGPGGGGPSGDGSDRRRSKTCEGEGGVYCGSRECIDGSEIVTGWFELRTGTCCAPVGDSEVVCGDEFFSAELGQMVGRTTGPCVDPDGDGIGKREVRVEGQEPFQEDCTAIPENQREGSEVPFNAIISIILTLAILIVFYSFKLNRKV